MIKVGGNVIDDEETLQSFLRDFAAINAKKILVHGGGKLATKLASRLGVEQQLVDGRRITDAETLKIVTMVYAGLVNKNIVAHLQAAGCNAVGLTGADGNAVLAHKRSAQDRDYGFAGDVDQVNEDLLTKLFADGFTPVLAPITHDGCGQLLNTNADTIAQETAKALSKTFAVNLVYLFEKSGVLLDANDDGSVISRINQTDYAGLKEKGLVFAGMIPKLDNAFAALQSGVQKVLIGNAQELTKITNGEAGTTITNG